MARSVALFAWRWVRESLGLWRNVLLARSLDARGIATRGCGMWLFRSPWPARYACFLGTVMSMSVVLGVKPALVAD